MSTNKVYGDNPNRLPLIEKKPGGKLKKIINIMGVLMNRCL